jgi:hypothetical protein
MRVLHMVIDITMLAMLDTRYNLALCRAIAFELV